MRSKHIVKTVGGSDWLSRFDTWSPAQKVLTCMVAFALPTHLSYKLVYDLFVGQLAPLIWPFWYGIITVVSLAAFSGFLILRDSSNRAPYYAFAYFYSAWAVSVVINVGAFDTIYGAFPLFIMLVSFLLDGWKTAKHVIGFWAVAALIVWVFQTLEWLEYAPGFGPDILSIRKSSSWFAVNVFWLGLALSVATTILYLVTNSRSKALALVEESRDVIRRYLPSAVADQIIAGGSIEVHVPQRRRVTILFADIVGFTEMADRVEPEVMTQVLGEYMSRMADLIAGYGGTLNEFAGDGLMSIFGAPVQLDPAEQAERAIEAAVAMQRVMAQSNEGWRPLGLGTKLKLRIGINTGIVSVGSYGSHGRMTYTAIGLQTNIAFRIQSHAAPGEILIGDSTFQLLPDGSNAEARGEIDCKGVHFRVPVYRIPSESETAAE